MNPRERIASVLARDSRFSIQAYLFMLDALEYTRAWKKRERTRSLGKGKARASLVSRHVSGGDLCEGARRLAIDHYGLLALGLLKSWGIRSTSDMGEIVYNLIASGDLEKTPNDAKADFDNAYDFNQAFCSDVSINWDEVA